MSSALGSVVDITPALQGYFAAPRLKSGRRMGIAVVHDVVGFGNPNCRYIVDHWASRGFEALMPDFFFDEVEPPGWPGDMAEDEFHEWLGNISNENFQEKCLPKVKNCIARLKEEGCMRFGIMGFGWGGMVAERAARSGHFLVAVSVDGYGHSAATYELTKEAAPEVVMLYMASADNQYFSLEAEEIAAAGAKVKVFQDVKEGFVARSISEEVASAADEALPVAEQVFSEACLKSTFVKVGTLHPDAQNIDVLVQVLEEPKAVERHGATFFEVLCGDETAQVVLLLEESHLTDIKLGQVVAARNSSITMVKGFMRLTVDQGGKINADLKPIVEIGKTNLSKIQYQLVEP